jgi:crotonobetainyl-CoA:carnitine CoA-transferase CaiB-like acyl-CoA transferase
VYFNSANRNKRSVCLDLKTPEGQEIARALIKKSDVVIQNFKFGDIDRLGLGYEDMSRDQPEFLPSCSGE